MNVLQKLRAFTAETASASQDFQTALDNLLIERNKIRVLEVGCGEKCNMSFRQDTYVTGIDPSESQLARNQQLDERICGLIETVDFPELTFDVIVFFDVLEHVDDPITVLDKCHDWLKQGGLLVIASPRVLTPEGLMTKFAPYGVHKFVYRNLLKTDGASMKGRDPFPTYLRLSMLPSRLKKYASIKGMKVVYSVIYKRKRVDDLRNASLLLGDAYSLLLAILNLITFDLWKPHLSSFHLVLMRT